MEQPPQLVTKIGEDGIETLRLAVEALIVASDTESPVKRVGIVLVYHGRAGHDFTTAWASAMRSLPRDDETASWRAIFHQQRDQWRDSYEARFGVLSAA